MHYLLRHLISDDFGRAPLSSVKRFEVMIQKTGGLSAFRVALLGLALCGACSSKVPARMLLQLEGRE
jgi:hypothetical protein